MPAVCAVTDVAGGAALSRHGDEAGNEAVVAVAVHGRWEAHGGGPHASVGERECHSLGEASPAGGGGCVGYVVLGGDRAGLEAGQAGGDDQRRSEPAKAAPNASIASPSASVAVATSPENISSCLKARWMTASAPAAAPPRVPRSSSEPR